MSTDMLELANDDVEVTVDPGRGADVLTPRRPRLRLRRALPITVAGPRRRHPRRAAAFDAPSRRRVARAVPRRLADSVPQRWTTT